MGRNRSTKRSEGFLLKLYTSYWAQVRNFPKNLIGLNTTIWPPKWRPLGKDNRGVLVIDCPPLKPGQECEGLCNGKCNPKRPHECQFLDTYNNQLHKIDFDTFIKKLQKLHDIICDQENFEDIDFAFIFYEKYDNPCSERWPFQVWMRYNGIEVEEWQK